MVVRDVDAVRIGMDTTDSSYWGVKLLMFTKGGPRETERFTGLKGAQFEGRMYTPGDFDDIGLDDEFTYRALVDDNEDFVEIHRLSNKVREGASSDFDFSGGGL